MGIDGLELLTPRLRLRPVRGEDFDAWAAFCADPETMDLLLSEGKLPNLARLRKEGAYGKLLSSKPMLSPILWTTIATGKPPADHGIGHFVAVNEKTGEQLPVTSQMRPSGMSSPPQAPLSLLPSTQSFSMKAPDLAARSACSTTGWRPPRISNV